MNDGGYWCRSCRGRADDLNDRGIPRGWYRLTLKTEEPPGERDVWPGRYCSTGCLTLACMVALGVEPEHAAAWLRGDG